MNARFHRLQQITQKIGITMALLGLLALSACGGAGGGTSDLLSGVGTGGSGLAEGTVTGFGSVFVDAVEYEDNNASVQQDDGTGSAVNADLKMGQRVRLQLSTDGSVKSATVLPQLVGPVTQALDASGTFKVMGQTVRLAGSAADTAQNASAALSGFGNASIAVGDEVEVHGTWVLDTATTTYVLTASRVEKLDAAPSQVLLSGVVQSLSVGSLRLNSASGTAVQTPSLPGSTATGDLVHVWATRAALNAAASTPVVASRVLDLRLSATELGEHTLRLGGPVSSYNTTSRILEIQGLKVQVPVGLKVDEAALTKGAFVALEAKRAGVTLVATALNLRSGTSGSTADLGRSVSLKGIASGVDWSASPVRFRLRNTDVRASQLVVNEVCRKASVDADLLVEVKGRLIASGDVVVATELQCTLQTTGVSTATVARVGTVRQLSLPTKTLVLQTARGNVSVQWNTNTFFSSEYSKHPESLTGQSVEVEGVNSTGVLQARKIKRYP